MARHKIIVTFAGNPNNNDKIIVSDDSGVVFDFVFVDAYSNPGNLPGNEVVIQSISENATASTLYSSFQSVYNTLGQWINQLNINVVTWEGNFDGTATITNTPNNVTLTVEDISDPLTISSIQPLTNVTSPCSLVDVQLISNVPFTKLNKPYTDTFAATTNYTVVDQPRGAIINYEIEDDLGGISSTTNESPPILDLNLISISVIGATVYISNALADLTLTYSLDGINYQTSNTFNLTGGVYDLYIKDQYDCVVQTQFEITEGEDGTITIPDPFFYYPEANPVRMAKRETWDDCTILKNDRNTLSCESEDRLSYGELQRWRECDTIYLQVKNNYSDLEIITTDDGLPVTLSQKSNFLNQKMALDCKVTKLSDGTVGIYFLSGDTYNYDTLDNLNEPYVLNGTLPAWAVQDNICTIGGINYRIIEISYNEELQVEQIVIGANLTDGDYIVKAIYNVFDYEIYEAAIDLTGRTDFKIEISYDGGLQWASERIWVDNDSERLVKVSYSMSYNTDMFWATGIIPNIRLSVDTSNLAIERTNEVYDTDDDVRQIDVNNYRVNTYKFFPVTKELARKIITIFSSSNIDINGIDYICTELNSESQGHSNLYVVTATMKEKGTGLAQQRSSSTTVTLSALVNHGNGYIKL